MHQRLAAEQTFEIVSENTTIGRSENNDIHIRAADLSRRHTCLMVQGGRLLAVDLGSSNGTSVNEHRISAPTELHDGAILRL